MVQELDNSNFKDAVTRAGYVLVDFWAPWCGPCKMLGPTIEKLSSEIKKIKFAKVNIQEHDDLASDYDVSAIPCMVLFKNGEEVNRIVGALPAEALKKKLEEMTK